jgi:signal peptidase I
MQKTVRIPLIIAGCIVLLAIAAQAFIEYAGTSRWDTLRRTPLANENYAVLFPPIDRFQYRIGDLVLVQRSAQPDIGDIVYYDADKNKTYCMAFGPSVGFAKIVGLPGDTVTINPEYYVVNGNKYIYEERYYMDQKLHTKQNNLSRLMWGGETYEDITGEIELTVPDDEYLADELIGNDCSPRKPEEVNTLPYTRLTVKEEALIGVVVCKLGHSFCFEKRERNAVY